MSFEYLAEAALIVGVSSGGFERFFQQMGRPTDHPAAGQPPFVPDFPRMQAAAQAHDMEFLPGFEWRRRPIRSSRRRQMRYLNRD